MIHIGTSGFSYDDWVGTWYPSGLPKSRMLDYYAGIFTALEVNATYYRTPPRKSAEGMVRAAAGRLRFAVKAPGALTHERRLGEEVVPPFRRFLEPFEESGCLAAVLLQFPNAFRAAPEATDFLAHAIAALSPLPQVVEMRHASWDGADSDARLADWNLSRAILDQPRLRGLSEAARIVYTGPIAYYRFHGRNAESWYAGSEGGSARYRYRYLEEELTPWVPLIREGSAKSESTLVFFNNHPDGAAPHDAQLLARKLGVDLGRGEADLFGAVS